MISGTRVKGENQIIHQLQKGIRSSKFSGENLWASIEENQIVHYLEKEKRIVINLQNRIFG